MKKTSRVKRQKIGSSEDIVPALAARIPGNILQRLCKGYANK
jgi:hypothetical protein